MTRTAPPWQSTAAVTSPSCGEDDRDATNPGDDSHSEIYLRLFRNGMADYEMKLSSGGTSGTNWKHVTPDVGLDDRGNAVSRVGGTTPTAMASATCRIGSVSPPVQCWHPAARMPNTAGQQIWPVRSPSIRTARQQHQRRRVHRGMGGHPRLSGGDRSGGGLHRGDDQGVTRGDGQPDRRDPTIGPTWPSRPPATLSWRGRKTQTRQRIRQHRVDPPRQDRWHGGAESPLSQ